MRKPPADPTVRERHVQRRQGQARGQRVTHRPTDAAARAPIQHARHIQPAFGGVRVVMSATHTASRRAGAGVARNQWARSGIMITVGGLDAEASFYSLTAQAVIAHGAGRRDVARSAGCGDFCPAMHARTANRSARLTCALVGSAASCALARAHPARARFPGVITAPTFNAAHGFRSRVRLPSFESS